MSRDEISQRLETFGVLLTPQRLDVAEVILSRPQQASADQVLEAIQAMGSRISKATVYNTLNLFCERGLLRTVNVDPARQYYDPTIQPQHHFYNIDSGELLDIDPRAVSMQVTTPLPPGTEQTGIEVVIRVRDRQSAD